MAIRFKNERECYTVSEGGSEWRHSCHSIDTPIQEWNFFPANLDAKYHIGGTAPQGKFIDVQFPELDLWKERTYDVVKFKVNVAYTNTQTKWLHLSSAKLSDGVFTENNIRSARVNLGFLSLESLSAGSYTANINFEAYGIDSSGEEQYIENRTFAFMLSVLPNNGGGETNPDENKLTDKNLYSLHFNKSTKVLSGDTVILMNASFGIQFRNVPFNLKITRDEQNEGNRAKININIFNENDAEYDSTTSLIQKPTGSYTSSLEISGNGRNAVVQVSVQVTEDANDFDISPKKLDFVVMKNPSEVKTESISIANPNNLSIRISAKPSFIERAEILDGKLVLQTVASSTLALGDYSGEIVLQSGAITRRVAISLRVLQNIQSDFRGSAYFFALDKNKITMQRTKPNAVFVRMKMEMFFRGFGEEYQETQSYDYPYFKGKTEIYPGEEIQDFFIKCTDWDMLRSPNLNYHLALVNISLMEYDENDNPLSEFRIPRILFAPGRKPKCFPFFTDYAIRSTVSESIIRLNMETHSENPHFAQLNEQYATPYPPMPRNTEVKAINFDRKNFSNKGVLHAGDIRLIPLPNIDKVVHIFWENQNLVFDWFSATRVVKKSVDYIHLFNEEDEKSEKYGTKKTETLTLNTGWVLREEIDLIDSLIASRICFLQIEDKQIKAFPIAKKNELWNSEEHLFQMDLEFRLIP